MTRSAMKTPPDRRRPSWDGTAAPGWHWLRRRRDDAEILAFAVIPDWRIADRIGRTTTHAGAFVRRHYDHIRAVLPPRLDPKETRHGR